MLQHDRVSLEARFAEICDYWSPKIIAQVNDQYVKLAKLKGTLCWHAHEHEDELFQVLRGSLTPEFEGGKAVTLQPGDIYVVPRGVLHNPVAEEETWVMLVETVSTLHTGAVEMEKTRSIAEQLA